MQAGKHVRAGAEDPGSPGLGSRLEGVAGWGPGFQVNVFQELAEEGTRLGHGETLGAVDTQRKDACTQFRVWGILGFRI